MNELELLRELRADLPGPSPSRLAAGRERLLASIAQAPTGHPALRRPRLHAPRLRLTIPAAAALAVGLWLVLTPGARQARPMVRVSLADQVLRSAAIRAAARPAVKPRPNQWIYTRLVSYSSGAGRSTSVSWLRFDGRAEAYYQGGQLIVHRTPGVAERGGSALKRFLADATTATAYQALAALPARPQQLLRAVVRQVPAASIAGSGWDPARGRATRAQLEFGFLADLLWNAAQAAPPQAQARAFHALAAIPGVRARQGVRDALGRPAIAVSIGGIDQQLLLDPTTFTVTGQRTLSNGAWPAPAKSGRAAVPKGKVVQSLAWAAITLVDRPGGR